MGNYSWTARDRNGKPVVREVTANTGAEARAILLAEGCTDLKLIEDEIVEAVRAGFPKKFDRFGAEIKSTAADRLKYRGKPRKTFFRVVKNSILQDWKLYLLLVGLLGFAVYREDKPFIIYFAIGLAAWPVYRVWLGLPGIYLAKINKARDWHRWSEMLELVAKLEKIQKFNRVKVPPVVLARYRARALAGLGRLPEALEQLKPFENQPSMPGWLYNTHVAGLYHLANQHDRALEFLMLAIQEKPTPTLYANLADALLRYKKNTVGARAALAEVEKGALTEILQAYLIRSRGILAYLEGDYASARKELEAGLKIVEARNQPRKESYLIITKSYLCCVLAKQGEMAEARKLLAQAREFLIATNQAELLEECDVLAGRP